MLGCYVLLFIVTAFPIRGRFNAYGLPSRLGRVTSTSPSSAKYEVTPGQWVSSSGLLSVDASPAKVSASHAMPRVSVDSFLARQSTRAVFATIEPAIGVPDRIRVTPWNSASGCTCASAIEVPRAAIEAVTPTRRRVYCCGKILTVVELHFGEPVLQDVFAQLGARSTPLPKPSPLRPTRCVEACIQARNLCMKNCKGDSECEERCQEQHVECVAECPGAEPPPDPWPEPPWPPPIPDPDPEWPEDPPS